MNVLYKANLMCPPSQPPLLSLTLTSSDPHTGCLPPHRKERGSPQPLEGLCSLLRENRFSHCHYIYTAGAAKEHVLKALHAMRGPNSPAPYDLCHTALCGCYFYSKSRLIVKLIINHLIIIIYSNCTSSLTGSLSTQYNSTYSHSDLLITSLLVLAFIAHIPFLPAY